MKKKILTALLSAGVALSLWLYVVTVVSPNSDKHYYNIPVSLQGEVLLQERSLMITTVDLPTVSLHLEGNRTNLNKLNNSNITLVVDVSRIGEPGVHELSYTPTYPGDVPNNAVNVLSRNPGTIRLNVEERVRKSVPIDIQYTGTLPENYMADKENKTLDYEEVNVVGPKSTVDKIAMARISVDLNDRSESISQQYTYTLCDEKGAPVDAEMVTTDVESVTLTLRVVRVKEVALTVNVIDGGGATKDTSLITVDPQTIRVSGSDSLLEDLETLELGTIHLGEMLADESLSYTIVLPEGITNETGVLEAVVDVKFPNLATKTVTVKAFETVNVPEGLKADVITKRLEITLRGPKSVIDKVSEENIKVKVDFTDEQEGTATIKAEIVVDVPGVGAVGIYNVTATLRKAK